MASRRAIGVRIYGQEYRVASETDEEGIARVQRAAELVDETMGKIRERTGVVDTQNLAVLAALNIANRYIGRGEGPARESGGDVIDPERVEALIRLVESATSGEAGSAP